MSDDVWSERDTNPDAIDAARTTPFGHTLTATPTAVLARATDDDFPPGTAAAHHDENVLAWV